MGKILLYYAQFRNQLVLGLKRDEKWKISSYETDDLYDQIINLSKARVTTGNHVKNP